jgi:hypothetical protein
MNDLQIKSFVELVKSSSNALTELGLVSGKASTDLNQSAVVIPFYHYSGTAVHVCVSMRELQMNTSKSEMINLVKEKIRNAEIEWLNSKEVKSSV